MGVHDLHGPLSYSAMISSSNVRTKGVPVEVTFNDGGSGWCLVVERMCFCAQDH